MKTEQNDLLEIRNLRGNGKETRTYLSQVVENQIK